MKLKNIFAFSLLATLFMTGCVKELPTDSLQDIQLEKTYISIPAEGGSVSVKLTASGPWNFVTDKTWPVTISSDKDGNEVQTPHWLSEASVMSGEAGEFTVSFSAEAVAGGREITLQIKTEANIQRLCVRQGSLDPVAMTCKEIKTSAVVGASYLVKAKVTKLGNYATYGAFFVNDGTYEEDVQIYGSTSASRTAYPNVEPGDYVEFTGVWSSYKNFENVEISKLEKALLKLVTAAPAEGYAKEGGDITLDLEYKGVSLDYSIPEEMPWISIKSVKTEEGIPSKLDPNPANKAQVVVHLDANEGGDRNGSIAFSSASGSDVSNVYFDFLQKGAIIEATAAEINAAEDGLTQYRYTGYVSKVEDAAKGKIYVTDYTGTVYLYKVTDYAASGVEEGDIITVVGKKSSFNGAPQLIESVVEKRIDVKDIDLASFKALEDNKEAFYRISGTVTESTEPNTKFDLQTYGNFALTDGTTEVYVYGVVPGYGGPSKQFATLGVEKGDKLTIVCYKTSYTKNNYVLNQAGGAFYVSHEKGSSEGGDEGGEEGGETPSEDLITKNISEISGATANGTQVSTMKFDDVVTLTASAGSNNGKVYSDGAEWRFYQSETGTLTVTAKEGYTLEKIKVTYTNKNSGSLMIGNAALESDSIADVSGNSVVLTVGNTGTATNGQAKITAISLKYKAN